MTKKTRAAALAGAALTALAAAPASARIIEGYTDLYVTEGGLGYYPTGGATLCRDLGTPLVCAKARFNFRYDTAKPAEELLANLVLLEGYRLLDEPGGYHDLVTTIEGVDYLYYGPFGQRAGPGVFFDQLSRMGEPLIGGLEQSDLKVYGSSATFAGGSRSVDLRYVGSSEFSKPYYGCDGPEHQRNEHQFRISTELGGSFESGLYYSDECSNYTREYLVYYFDNSPANWVDGPPEARVWIVGVPEPASLSLLGLGLAGLAVAARARKKP